MWWSLSGWEIRPGISQEFRPYRIEPESEPSLLADDFGGRRFPSGQGICFLGQIGCHVKFSQAALASSTVSYRLIYVIQGQNLFTECLLTSLPCDQGASHDYSTKS